MVSSGAKSNYFLKAAHHKFLDRFPPCSRKQNYLLCGPVTTWCVFPHLNVWIVLILATSPQKLHTPSSLTYLTFSHFLQSQTTRVWRCSGPKRTWAWGVSPTLWRISTTSAAFAPAGQRWERSGASQTQCAFAVCVVLLSGQQKLICCREH